MSPRVLRSATWGLSALGIVVCAPMLFSDFVPVLPHAVISALPLILIGAAYVLLQLVLRPHPKELVQRLLLGLAFILWGISQLLPPGQVANVIGDLVIMLFVVDLGLINFAHLRFDDQDTP